MKWWTKAAVQGAACGLVFGVVVLVGGCLQQPATHDVARARRFEVVDAGGKLRATLGVFPQQDAYLGEAAGLLLNDATGKVQAGLSVFSRGSSASLSFLDAAGKPRVNLRVAEGASILHLSDAAGKPRLNLDVLAGVPSLRLLDATGEIRAELETEGDGNSGFALFDAAGKLRANLGLSPDGRGGLSLFDAESKPRASLSLDEKGHPGLLLKDAAGKARAMLYVPHEAPFLGFLDAAGKPFWKAP
jgi:hypothetical protein